MTRLIPFASMILAASIAASAAVRRDRPSARQDEDELARVGGETTEKVCAECHSIEDVTASRRTPREWKEMVVSMATRGARATDDQFATITRYLTRYYGIVPVNTATADELSAVLGLTPKEADAIVGYRNAHGKFSDVDALLKVPDIDKSKIEAQPDALRF